MAPKYIPVIKDRSAVDQLLMVLHRFQRLHPACNCPILLNSVFQFCETCPSVEDDLNRLHFFEDPVELNIFGKEVTFLLSFLLVLLKLFLEDEVRDRR